MGMLEGKVSVITGSGRGKTRAAPNLAVANALDVGKRWTVEEIDQKIRELGDLGIPPMWC